MYAKIATYTCNGDKIIQLFTIDLTLLKLHRNFSHPQTEKLLNLLSFAKPDENHSEIKKVPEDIANKCEASQRFTATPVRFKANLQTEENLVFCEEISIDIIFIDNVAIVHNFDTETPFSASTFLDNHGETYGQSVDGICLTLNACRCNLCTDYPDLIRSNQGSLFTSNRWGGIVESKDIQTHLSGARAHS